MTAREGRDTPDFSWHLVDGPEATTKVKGSRFVGRALAANSLEAALARLETIRKRDHDATHHCWAAIWEDPRGEGFRSDDDGEPSGTAGRPILRHLQDAGVADGLVVVTRWFGGTKLGTGGLAQAYGDAAREALLLAPRQRLECRAILEVHCAFDDLGAMEAQLARLGDEVRDVRRNFEPRPSFRIEVGLSRATGLRTALTEALAGRLEIVEAGQTRARSGPPVVGSPGRG